MSRPHDWAPLAERDPLPGDPDRIFEEAFRLRNMAAGITDQVTKLRRIGADESMTGQVIGELRASAIEVAKKLEKVADRYSKVSGILLAWAPELEEFQAATLKAWEKATEAERQRNRAPHADLLNPNLFTYQTMPAGGLGVEPELTGADALLAEARTDFWRVIDEAAARDRHWAHQIGEAIDDSLTDGFFDHIHQWAERNNSWIDQLTDKLGWVTTAAAIGVLFVPGGAELAAVVEVVETVGQVSAGINLAAHTVQVAGGEKGARFDLGMDILALGSLGLAKGLTSRLGRTAEQATEAAAEANRAGTTREELARVLADPAASSTARREARRRLAGLNTRAVAAEGDTSAEVAEASEVKASLGRVLLAGDREAADSAATIDSFRTQYGGDETMNKLVKRGERLASAGQANFLTATAVDAADKTASHSGLNNSYGGFKNWVATGGPLR